LTQKDGFGRKWVPTQKERFDFSVFIHQIELEGGFRPRKMSAMHPPK
jgi:hypothetical protein